MGREIAPFCADEFQRQVAATLLQEASAEGMEVHRATVLNALVNALRLTFPTIVELTGRDFFDQVAAEYVRQNPPDCAVCCFGTRRWSWP